jgi:hypothetical protein
MSLHPRFAEAVRRGHPNASRRDVVVRDDGEGPYLAEWNLPGEPPTDAEIDAALAVIDAEKARLAEISSDVDLTDLQDRMRSATAAQIKTYVQNNVTDLASAKVLFAKILLLLAKENN